MDILNLLASNINSFTGQWIYLIDDASLFQWTWYALIHKDPLNYIFSCPTAEITAFVLKDRYGVEPATISNLSALGNQFTFAIPNTTRTALLSDYPLFYMAFLKKCYSTLKAKYRPALLPMDDFSDDMFDRHYDYCPEFFLGDKTKYRNKAVNALKTLQQKLTTRWNILVFTIIAVIPFVQWCVKKAIPFQPQDILRYAVKTGNLDLLEFILTLYTPSCVDFLYTLGVGTKELLDELKMDKVNSLSFIGIIHKHLSEEVVIPEGCSDEVLRYLQWKGIL